VKLKIWAKAKKKVKITKTGTMAQK